MTKFKGKAIYQPSGKAAEYAEWACNFYVGCSNGCEYCYCKKGILKGVMGQDKPQLKKCLDGHFHAMQVFAEELLNNLFELQKHGLFFSFTTDPFLEGTSGLTWQAAELASSKNVPIKFLTKRADWVDAYLRYYTQLTARPYLKIDQKFYSFGFTLTGHDELESGASTNIERIIAMEKLHKSGFKTWASIEPIINFQDSLAMIKQSNGICDLFKIGLESSSKKYYPLALRDWIEDVSMWVGEGSKIYFKDSLLKAAGYNREDLPKNCVNSDYNMFNPNTSGK